MEGEEELPEEFATSTRETHGERKNLRAGVDPAE